ncbi:MAG: NAD-dependent epimerase/dehydratase family protein [Planctomycetes bacterium]|nr:NAD-dependent epimerase/dehydratase family protein [Planctomycetota bacterium]
MRVLVLGGTRLIGRAIVEELLRRGDEVTVLHRGKTPSPFGERVREILADHANLGSLDLPTFDAAIHVIALTEADTRRAVDRLRGRVGFALFVSSVDVYEAWAGVLEGRLVHEGPLREDSPLRSRLYPYRDQMPDRGDYDKILVERVALAEPTLPACVLRLPMVYGPHDAQERTRPIVSRMMRGEPVPMGGGAEWRVTRCFVEDVAGAAAQLLDRRPAGETFHVGETEAMSQRAWAEAMSAQVRLVPDDELTGDLTVFRAIPQDIVLDTAKIRSLGYRETARDPLKRTVEWQIGKLREGGG